MPRTYDILQHILPTLPEQTWLTHFVAVFPGVRDAQILAVAAQLALLAAQLEHARMLHTRHAAEGCDG